MTAPILTLAEVMALSGFTEGPWRMSIENGSGIAAGRRKAIVWAYSSPLGWPCVQVERASKPLVLAAPALHATCLHLHAEVARLSEARDTVAMMIPLGEENVGTVEESLAAHLASQRERIAGLSAEVARLTAELAEERKPLADAWRQDRDARGPFWWRPGCMTSKVRGEGRRERDLELVAAGWSLVGGVFGEVSDAKT